MRRHELSNEQWEKVFNELIKNDIVDYENLIFLLLYIRKIYNNAPDMTVKRRSIIESDFSRFSKLKDIRNVEISQELSPTEKKKEYIRQTGRSGACIGGTDCKEYFEII